MDDNYDLSKLRKKPKRKNSRAKGAGFERNIAKKLNERLKTEEFARSPGSGAFATTHSLPDHLKIYGDLITPQNFKFCIECKHGYNNINLYSLYNDSSDLWKFIEQCEKDSAKCQRQPIIIFKQDRQPILAIIRSEVYVEDNLKYIEINKNNKFYKIYLFDELLKCYDSFWID